MKNNKFDINAMKESIINPNRNISIITLRNEENKILLVRTKKLPNKWQPIGGGININETPEEAIIREVAEETGFNICYDMFKKIIELPYDFGEGKIYCFDMCIKISKKDINVSEKEILAYCWFSLDETSSLPMYSATAEFLNALAKKSNEI